MIFTEIKLKGAFIIDIQPMEDERGFFARSYSGKEFKDHGLVATIEQANISYNRKKGTLRGMHMQLSPYGETKLVRCSAGAIYDVIIDLRAGSPTFGQWEGIELNQNTHRTLYVPEGFAHGFITLTDNAEVTYLVSQYYTPGAERGFRWNDPAFNIKWPEAPVVISEKDQSHPLFEAETYTLTQKQHNVNI